MSFLLDFLAYKKIVETEYRGGLQLPAFFWQGGQAGPLFEGRKEPLENFFHTLGVLNAQELSCGYLAHKLHESPRAILSLFGEYELAGLWFHLKSFDAQSEEIHDKSKGYIVNHVDAARLVGIQTAEGLTEHQKWGALFESFIVTRMRVLLKGSSAQLYYWRTADGLAEVDAVIVQGEWLYPIEIKSTARASRSNAKKIAIFRDLYAPSYRIAPGLIIYAGNQAYLLDNEVAAVSWRSLWEKNTK
jgi:predicted AAA+ superfamily ATPase